MLRMVVWFFYQARGHSLRIGSKTSTLPMEAAHIKGCLKLKQMKGQPQRWEPAEAWVILGLQGSRAHCLSTQVLWSEMRSRNTTWWAANPSRKSLSSSLAPFMYR